MNDTTYRTATPEEFAEHDRRVLAARRGAPLITGRLERGPRPGRRRDRR